MLLASFISSITHASSSLNKPDDQEYL
ncbi:hypothetical protein LTSESEN_1783, partial [Salmonella enterica subsp. enterica serovar Senftenberg str. A4-543]